MVAEGETFDVMDALVRQAQADHDLHRPSSRPQAEAPDRLGAKALRRETVGRTDAFARIGHHEVAEDAHPLDRLVGHDLVEHGGFVAVIGSDVDHADGNRAAHVNPRAGGGRAAGPLH